MLITYFKSYTSNLKTYLPVLEVHKQSKDWERILSFTEENDFLFLDFVVNKSEITKLELDKPNWSTAWQVRNWSASLANPDSEQHSEYTLEVE